jgi:hypothetical protein
VKGFMENARFEDPTAAMNWCAMATSLISLENYISHWVINTRFYNIMVSVGTFVRYREKWSVAWTTDDNRSRSASVSSPVKRMLIEL